MRFLPTGAELGSYAFASRAAIALSISISKAEHISLANGPASSYFRMLQAGNDVCSFRDAMADHAGFFAVGTAAAASAAGNSSAHPVHTFA